MRNTSFECEKIPQNAEGLAGMPKEVQTVHSGVQYLVGSRCPPKEVQTVHSGVQYLVGSRCPPKEVQTVHSGVQYLV